MGWSEWFGGWNPWKDTRLEDEPGQAGAPTGGGGIPEEPPYWHGHSWQPTGVTWDGSAGRFSDGSPPTGPGGGPWRGPVIGPR